jgi:hypothetical protein
MDGWVSSALTLASALDAGQDPSGLSAPTTTGVALRASLPQIGIYSRRSLAAASSAGYVRTDCGVKGRRPSAGVSRSSAVAPLGGLYAASRSPSAAAAGRNGRSA